MRMFRVSYAAVNFFPVRVSQMLSIINFSFPVIVQLHLSCYSLLIAYDFYFKGFAKLLKMIRDLTWVSLLSAILVGL